MTNKNGSGSGAAPTPPRKRKMKGIVIEEPSQPQPQLLPPPPPPQLPTPPPQLPTPPPPPPPAYQNNTPLFNITNNPRPQNIFSYYPPPNVGPSSSSQVQRILNAAAPVRPFSFTSLLTAPYHQIEEHYHQFINPTYQIDQLVSFHSENLKKSLTGVVESHQNLMDERAAKKLKEKEVELQIKCSQNAELESMIEHYKNEQTEAQYRIMVLEQTVTSLRTELRDVMESIAVDEEEEEEESSSEEPDRVGMVRLECKVCERQVANVMMWPCRHICVCVRCDTTTNACPVCRSVKTSSVRVVLP